MHAIYMRNLGKSHVKKVQISHVSYMRFACKIVMISQQYRMQNSAIIRMFFACYLHIKS